MDISEARAKIEKIKHEIFVLEARYLNKSDVPKWKQDSVQLEIKNYNTEIEQLRTAIEVEQQKQAGIARANMLEGLEQAEQQRKDEGRLFTDRNYATIETVQVNEQEVFRNHYSKIVSLQKELSKNERLVSSPKATSVQRANAQGQIVTLKKEIQRLESIPRDVVIHRAKQKRVAYLEAQNRYNKLGMMTQLKLKITGKIISWDKVKNDSSMEAWKLDQMYQANQEEPEQRKAM